MHPWEARQQRWSDERTERQKGVGRRALEEAGRSGQLFLAMDGIACDCSSIGAGSVLPWLRLWWVGSKGVVWWQGKRDGGRLRKRRVLCLSQAFTVTGQASAWGENRVGGEGSGHGGSEGLR